MIHFFISVVLEVPHFGISASGTAAYTCEEDTKACSKGLKLSIANKMAYARACSDAFTTLAIVLLPSNKHYVTQIDTTESISLDFKVQNIKKQVYYLELTKQQLLF